jgi:hypothetical protein
MHIKSAANSDTVTFNDHNCNYHSKDYYCQQAAGSPTPPKPKWAVQHACKHCSENNGVWQKKNTQRECEERCEKEGTKWMTYKPATKNCRCDKTCNRQTKYGRCEGTVYSNGKVTPAAWYCVAAVNRNTVSGPYSSLTSAKTELNKRKGSSSNRQMICEMSSSGAKADPHSVGGQNQGAGSKGGFEKWWYNWDDIKRMNKMCQDNTACKNGPTR